MDKLLTHLAQLPEDGRWQQWRYQRIHGGANNILFRVDGEDGSYAVKFTIRDKRRRGWREFQALSALHEVGVDIAPRPVLLDETGYTQPVVVQTWLDGDVTAVPPQIDAEWVKLIEAHVAMHTVTPQNCTVELETAVINFSSPAAGLEAIQQQLDMMPVAHHPPELNARMAQIVIDAPPPPNLALCHVDANTLNLLRTPAVWRIVDWENSGWGDPAFEIVDMMTHPQLLDVPLSRWRWVMGLYAAMSGDETAVTRIQACYPVMLLWWVARLARMLYDIPRGADQRLTPPAPDWDENLRAKQRTYWQRACDRLDSVN